MVRTGHLEQNIRSETMEKLLLIGYFLSLKMLEAAGTENIYTIYTRNGIESAMCIILNK